MSTFPNPKRLAEVAEDRRWLSDETRKEIVRRLTLLMNLCTDRDDPARHHAAREAIGFFSGMEPTLDYVDRIAEARK